MSGVADATLARSSARGWITSISWPSFVVSTNFEMCTGAADSCGMALRNGLRCQGALWVTCYP